MPAKPQPIAATRKESTTAGPAFSAAAMPVSENNPAPMMAPMPRPIRLKGPERTAQRAAPGFAAVRAERVERLDCKETHAR